MNFDIEMFTLNSNLCHLFQYNLNGGVSNQFFFGIYPAFRITVDSLAFMHSLIFQFESCAQHVLNQF